MDAPAPARPGRPPARPRRVALPASARPRAAVPLPARERRAHDAARRHRRAARSPSSGRPSTTPPARRSTRARGCSASATPAGRRSTGWRGRATRRRTTSPSRACRASTSRSRALKTALLYRVRDLDDGELAARRADLAASYQRAIVRALVGRVEAARRATRRRRRRRRRELGAAGGAPRRRARAAPALHRQRGDDRVRGALRRARPLPRLPWARCVLDGAVERRSRCSRSSRPPSRCSASPRPAAARPRSPARGAASWRGPRRRTTARRCRSGSG